jgi:hypothetical protein
VDEELPICLVRVGEFKPPRAIVGSDGIIDYLIKVWLGSGVSVH